MGIFTQKLRTFLRGFGPGIITGASDDDPSGILSYLQAGVIMGLRSLWLVLITLPLMYGVQEICARIGYVTDKGIARLIKENYPKRVLYFVATISVVVISINIGADLLAAATVSQDALPLGTPTWLVLWATAILLGVVLFSYDRLAKALKWLSLSLFLYIATVFFMKIDWGTALYETLIPSFSTDKESILLIAAVLGTTISPYLFFWQASEEVEERDERVRTGAVKKFIVTKHELKNLKEDIFTGMFFSNATAWFMIVGASALASQHGVARIANFTDAAAVLRPVVGPYAYTAFALGIVGTALLAIPVLAGAAGYILAEVFGWSEGMNKTFRDARGFYISIILATVAGVAVNVFGFDPIELLVYAAVLYTLITPFLLWYIMGIANNKKIMKENKNDYAANFFGYATLGVMAASAIAYIWSLFA